VRRARVAVFLATAIVLGATACGGGSGTAQQPSRTVTVPATRTLKLGKTAYERKMRKLGDRLGKTIDGLYPLSSGSKGSDTAKRTAVKLQNAQAVISDVYAQLKKIVPPGPIAKQQRELEAGVRVLINQLGEMVKDAQTGAIAAFVAGSNFTSSLQMINAAAAEMTAQGYDIIGPRAGQNP
jgi:hypothetical protein